MIVRKFISREELKKAYDKATQPDVDGAPYMLTDPYRLEEILFEDPMLKLTDDTKPKSIVTQIVELNEKLFGPIQSLNADDLEFLNSVTDDTKPSAEEAFENELRWLKDGAELAKSSVDSAMSEQTAYAYGYMHGKRESAAAIDHWKQEWDEARGEQIVDEHRAEAALNRIAKLEADKQELITALDEALSEVRSWYPYDIFPDSGESLDCKSAKMARLTCDNIERLNRDALAKVRGEK